MKEIKINKEGNITANLVFVETGSRFEDNSIKGVSHFLEHMMFKGTKKRNAKQISYEIEKLGATFNAFTDTEITAYWIKSDNKHKNIAKEILKDMIYNSTFPKKEIEKERQVIKQELNMYKDNPTSYVGDIFYNNLIKKNSGLDLPIIGTEKSLKNIDRRELQSHYNSWYSNPVFIQVGKIKSKNNFFFEKLSTPTIIKTKNTILGNYRIEIIKPGLTQANVIMGNVGYSGLEKNINTLFSLKLLSGVLNDMSGRLFSSIREKNNLAYSVYFGYDFFSCGSFVWHVSLGLNKKKINLAYDLIMKELTRTITKKEIEYALSKTIGETSLINENATTIATKVAYAIKRNIDYNEIIFNYDKHLKKASKNLNEFAKSLNFKNNLLCQLVGD